MFGKKPYYNPYTQKPLAASANGFFYQINVT